MGHVAILAAKQREREDSRGESARANRLFLVERVERHSALEFQVGIERHWGENTVGFLVKGRGKHVDYVSLACFNDFAELNGGSELRLMN